MVAALTLVSISKSSSCNMGKKTIWTPQLILKENLRAASVFMTSPSSSHMLASLKKTKTMTMSQVFDSTLPLKHIHSRLARSTSTKTSTAMRPLSQFCSMSLPRGNSGALSPASQMSTRPTPSTTRVSRSSAWRTTTPMVRALLSVRQVAFPYQKSTLLSLTMLVSFKVVMTLGGMLPISNTISMTPPILHLTSISTITKQQ